MEPSVLSEVPHELSTVTVEPQRKRACVGLHILYKLATNINRFAVVYPYFK